MDGAPQADVHECDIDRFEPHQLAPAYVARARRPELRRGLRHPPSAPADGVAAPAADEPVPRPRGGPGRPLPRGERLGAAALVRGERRAARPIRDRIPTRGDWASRYWSPIAGAEALATRDGVALYDMTSLKRLEVTGPGALAFLDGLTTNRLDRPVGAVVYTLLLERGRRDPQRPDDRPARTGPVPDRRQRQPRPRPGSSATPPPTAASRSATSRPAPAAWACGVRRPGTCWRPWRTSTSPTRRSATSGPARSTSATCPSRPSACPTSASSGGSCTRRPTWAASSGTSCGRPAGRTGCIAAGRSAFGSLRLEKGYRSWGTDMTTEHDPYEAGLGFAVRLRQGRVHRPGRDRRPERGDGRASPGPAACSTTRPRC